MKLIEFKEYNNLDKERVLNKRKIIVFMVVLTIVIIATLFSIIYICNQGFRKWADSYILMKNVKEGELPYIDLDTDENISVLAYDKYVALLNDNKFKIYNSSAKETASLDVSISNPLSATNGKYIAIAEKGKQKIYLISGTKILWNSNVDGNIARIDVNDNGYISIVCSGTTYKSVIIVFDASGMQILKTYIPNNSVIDSVVSSDNKYLSFAEIDTSETLIKSTVKTLDIKSAENSQEISTAYTYELEKDTLITNLRYQGSKNLICMCNNGIYNLTDGNIQNMMNFEEENKKYTFAGIDLLNNIYEVEEKSNGIENQVSDVKLINTGTKKINTYSIDSIAKGTSSSGDSIAINLGNEIYFINSKGWLKKKYIADEEIRKVIVSDRVAAIVFRDKIEILVL